MPGLRQPQNGAHCRSIEPHLLPPPEPIPRLCIQIASSICAPYYRILLQPFATAASAAATLSFSATSAAIHGAYQQFCHTLCLSPPPPPSWRCHWQCVHSPLCLLLMLSPPATVAAVLFPLSTHLNLLTPPLYPVSLANAAACVICTPLQALQRRLQVQGPGEPAAAKPSPPSRQAPQAHTGMASGRAATSAAGHKQVGAKLPQLKLPQCRRRSAGAAAAQGQAWGQATPSPPQAQGRWQCLRRLQRTSCQPCTRAQWHRQQQGLLLGAVQG